jgi:hypothetical protein
MGILLTKVTHGVCDPKELKATTSSSYIPGSVVGCVTLDFLGKDQGTNEEPKNWQVPKVDF